MSPHSFLLSGLLTKEMDYVFMIQGAFQEVHSLNKDKWMKKIAAQIDWSKLP